MMGFFTLIWKLELEWLIERSGDRLLLKVMMEIDSVSLNGRFMRQLIDLVIIWCFVIQLNDLIHSLNV
jgi:hypothetical protein